jgi:hypothetical protein
LPKSKEQTGVYFTLNTLEFLQRVCESWCSPSWALCEPETILELQEGLNEAVERVRT